MSKSYRKKNYSNFIRDWNKLTHMKDNNKRNKQRMQHSCRDFKKTKTNIIIEKPKKTLQRR